MNDEERGSVEDLATAAGDLRTAVHDLQSRVTFARRWNIVLSVLVAAMVVGAVVLATVIVDLNRTQNAEDATRHQVLCPLYTLFVQSVNKPRGPTETAEQYAVREAVKPQILKSYSTLGCQ